MQQGPALSVKEASQPQRRGPEQRTTWAFTAEAGVFLLFLVLSYLLLCRLQCHLAISCGPPCPVAVAGHLLCVLSCGWCHGSPALLTVHVCLRDCDLRPTDPRPKNPNDSKGEKTEHRDN